MRDKMLKHHFKQGILKEFHSALIMSKCQTNAEWVHIIEQLQRLESDMEEQHDAPAMKSPETVHFTMTGSKPVKPPALDCSEHEQEQ